MLCVCLCVCVCLCAGVCLCVCLSVCACALACACAAFIVVEGQNAEGAAQVEARSAVDLGSPAQKCTLLTTPKHRPTTIRPTALVSMACEIALMQ